MSASQRTIFDVLPSATLAVSRYAPGFLQRRGDGDALVEVVLARLEVQLPAGHFGADVLAPVLLDEPVADFRDVHLLPIELLGLRLEIGLHVVEQLADVDLVGDELDLLGVAEAEFDRGAAAGRLRHHAFELAPVADDLVEPLLVVPCASSPVGALDRLAPVLGSARILAAVLEDLGQAANRVQIVIVGVVGRCVRRRLAGRA